MMDNRHETTFGEFQVDERFKKLQRSLKLAVLRQEHSKSAHDEKASVATAWPSMSSINVDTVDSSFAPRTSSIKSEVLASSKNLRNMLFQKKNNNVRQEAMTTSSIKQCNGQQDSQDRNIMPPPVGNFVYRTFKEPQGKDTLSNTEETASTLLNKSIQSSTVNTVSLKNDSSCKSANTNGCKEYSNPLATPTIPVNNLPKMSRVFSNWRIMLNYRYELIIKGTLECGRIARSKPIIRRYSATCIESKYKHKYILQGNIVDERHGLPDYIRGKFYNGFPDDWENVYQIWRAYINQGCPVTFRWPTRITDSDDDLKSELTDLTYTCVKKKKATSATGSRNLNEGSKIENLDNASEEKGEYSYSTRSFQNYDKDTSLVKPFIPNSVEEDLIPVVQTKNSMLPRDEDKSIKSDTNPPCSSRKVNKLKDIFQEDKLNIIINNLADRNCSPQYIDKILEMLDCLDYVVSYRTESESNNDSVVSACHETSKLETISLQQRLACNDDSPTNFNKYEKLTELKSYTIGHSTDLGYGSVRNDSNAVQLLNAAYIESEHTDKDSDKLESEIYAGIPKISFEQVLKSREPFKKVPKRKTKRKTIYSVAENHATNLPYNENEFKSIHVANPIADTKKNSRCDESWFSITDDEMETMNNTRVAMGITQRPQEMTLPSHREVQRNNNFDVCGKSKSTMHVQNKQLYGSSEAQKINSNVFMKKQKIPCRVQKNVHSQFVSDVDYTTNSEVDIATTSSSKRKTSGNMIASQAKVDRDIVVTSENNNESNSEKPSASQKLCKEVVEQTKSETLMKKSKPIITSLIPINLNMKINKVDSRVGQMHNSKTIMNEDKQNANIQPVEETEKSVSITSVAMSKPAINDSHSKITIDDKRKARPITNNKNEMGNRNSTNSTTNPTTEQSKSKLGVEDNPKVLIAWMPRVVYYAKSKSELGLTFQGKLVNDVGHVVHRKFTTDIVQKRLSATLIETVNHEFYKLIGHINDSKHIFPKELMSQCRYGCPAKIEEFCLTWKTLQHVTEKLNDTTMDSLNAPVSSRGRHIVPPLSYWTGERITLKDNNPVYSPGSSQDSTLLSLANHSKETKNNSMDTEKEKQNVNSENTLKKQSVNKRPLLPELNKISGTNKNQTIAIEKSRTSKISPKVKAVNNTRKPDNSEKFRKSTNKKERLDIVRRLISYTDSSEEEQVAPRRKRMCTNQNASSEKSLPYALRKRRKMTYTYCQDVPRSENFLSEDEVS